MSVFLSPKIIAQIEQSPVLYSAFPNYVAKTGRFKYIKPANTTDIPEIMVMLNELNKQSDYSGANFVKIKKSLSQFLRTIYDTTAGQEKFLLNTCSFPISDLNRQNLIIYQNAEYIAGYGWAKPTIYPNEYIIDQIYVNPEFRNQGIASTILQHLFFNCITHAAERITVTSINPLMNKALERTQLFKLDEVNTVNVYGVIHLWSWNNT